jgi:3-oxoadipate enol-lactonase
MLTTLLALLVLSSPPDSGQFTSSGLWYTVSGNGPAVLLLHGANLDARSWADLPAALARDHRVIVTELRSHGRSRDAGGPFSWVDDAREVLDAAGIERATVIGHSLGAQIAIDLALVHPERVDALVLIGPAIGGRPAARPPAGFEPLVDALRAGDLTAAGVALAAMPVMTLYRDTTHRADVRAIVAANVRLFRASPEWVTPTTPPAFARLPSLRTPTFVLTGGRDPTEANDAARQLLAEVPGASGETLSACGHLLPLDCGPATIRAVRAFLARVRR